MKRPTIDEALVIIDAIAKRFDAREATHDENESIDGYDPHDSYAAAMRRVGRILRGQGDDS